MTWLVVAATLTNLPACTRPPEHTKPTADPEPPPPSAGFYSLVQAGRGRKAFRDTCAECHTLSDFRGRDFEWRWRRRSVWDLYQRVTRTMPENDPGVLPSQTYADILAYILYINEYASGSAELPPSEEAMDRIRLGPGAEKTGNPSGFDG